MTISKRLVMGITCLIGSQTSVAAAPTMEEVWQLLQAQQAQIEQLQEALTSSQRRLEDAQSRIASQSANQSARLTVAENAIEATANSIETVAYNNEGSDTHIGGYGELHYNNLDSGDEFDLHRFVLFFNHKFNDQFSLYSELEVEHNIAGEGQVGEVEVEQAFIRWDYNANHHADMGVFLVPVGILNETHEPDTFYGVERNSVEKQIVPATWWEAGVSFAGEIAPGWGYDLAAHSGLNLDTDNDKGSKRSSIRSARQKTGKANGDSLAYTARLRFNGIAGLQWNATIQYQADLAQGDADAVGIDEIDAMLFETNLNYQVGSFGLRALYARWDIDNEIEILNAGADEQEGWYLEPSYKFGDSFGLFARYSSYDLTAGDSAASNEKKQFDIGFNYWPQENVVIKVDVQRQDNDNGDDNDGFNVGVGYSF